MVSVFCSNELGGEDVWGEEAAAEGGEEVGGVEGAVRHPALGEFFQFGDGQDFVLEVEAGDDAAEGQVAGGEGVHPSQGAEEEPVGGPGADAAEGEEAFGCFFVGEMAESFQVQGAFGDGGRNVEDVFGLAVAELDGAEAGDALGKEGRGGREGVVGLTVVGESVAVVFEQQAADDSGDVGGYLLAEDGLDEGFENGGGLADFESVEFFDQGGEDWGRRSRRRRIPCRGVWSPRTWVRVAWTDWRVSWVISSPWIVTSRRGFSIVPTERTWVRMRLPSMFRRRLYRSSWKTFTLAPVPKEARCSIVRRKS